jgi:kynureninase
MNVILDRSHYVAMDAADPWSHLRDRFVLPDGVIYLDGNSLGPPTRHSADRLASFTNDQWAAHLVGGWRRDGWIDSPARLGARLAGFLGAHGNEVVAVDSTTINLFKLVTAAIEARPNRSTIVAADTDFPTDMYIVDAVAELYGRTVKRVNPTMMSDVDYREVAVVVCSHVHYRTGLIHNMKAITAAAHRGGALVLWDLSHSAGALPIDLNGDDVDLAVGCTYKYFNGGPGAPAYCFVAQRLHDDLVHPLTGWLGHEKPFSFDVGYLPAPGVERLVTGTPNVACQVTLEAALDALDGVDLVAMRAKAMTMTTLFVDLVEHHFGRQFELVSPRDPELRANHVAFDHYEGFAIIQALIARGVIGDYREPDAMRFGFAPMYLRYVDVFDAVTHLVEIMESEEYLSDEFQVRDKVT